LARDVCQRKLSVGADGLVILAKSRIADAKMTIFNADGSHALMCGSALRCISSLLHKKYNRQHFQIETDSGIRQGKISFKDNLETVEVEMGQAKFLRESIKVDEFEGAWIEVGNTHYVVYLDSLSADPHLLYGRKLELHPAFSEPVNVQFVRKISSHELELKIWERGSGATLACGTGATAAVFYGIKHQGLEKEVRVNMPGGDVQVSYNPSQDVFFLSGSVSQISYGEYLWKISAPI
jgi:diaminopimelate epimerase